jgi:hypothetical protein
VKWNFPCNNSGEIHGLNNSGIETFLGTPYKSLAREICQNSLDAVFDETKPVVVEFVLSEVDTGLIPDIEGLKRTFSFAKSFWESQKIELAVEFFNTAIELSSSSKISVLTIRDRNTRGLSGAHKGYNTPWHNLTKSSGVSDKSPTSGGSFGIGKYAPFACSYFRTVMYSTFDEEGIVAGQGVSRLTSFQDETGELRDDVGFLGGDKNSALTCQLLVAGIPERIEAGTDVSVLGFKHSTNWEADVAISVIDSFIDAIFRDKLCVIVGNRTIDKSTLNQFIEEYKGQFCGRADEYYSVLVSEKTFWFIDESFRGLGRIELGLQIREGFRRRVAMVRKTGMKIMDRGNISGTIPFAGLMRIQGVEINKKLREIENPQHDKWEPDRAKNSAEANTLIKRLGDFIRAKLEEIIGKEDDEAIDPGVGDHLPYEDLIDEKAGTEEEESLSDKIKLVERSLIKKPKRKRKKSSNADDGEDIDQMPGDEELSDVEMGSGHGDGEGKGDDDGAGDDVGDGDGKDRKQILCKPFPVVITHARVMCIDKNRGEYLLRFTPLANAGNGYISVNVVAESDTYKAKVKRAYVDGQVVNVVGNQLCGFSFVKGKPIEVKVVLDYHDYCSLEVFAHGYKE